jgi:MYXO-CTERM domain-containing protein
VKRRNAWLLALPLLGACEVDGELDAPPPMVHPGPGATPEVRPDTPGNNLQFSFDRDDTVETHGSSDGRFLIHFTRSGPNRVDDGDSDANGVPDFVEQVADVYVEVLAHYESLGLRAPESDGDIEDNGGDDRFDVYLVDFAGIGDGAFRQDGCLTENPDRCIGFMTQENDFVGYGYPSTLIANRILGSHEFFHAIQAAYDSDQGSVLSEGTAVWGTESYDSSLNDFEAFTSGYLANADRPLDQPLPGPVDPFSYGAAIFFQFLSERYDPDAIRILLERCENGGPGGEDPMWMSQLDAVADEVGGGSFAEVMVEFATWNLYTDDFADPALAYQNGAALDRVKMNDVDAPYVDEEARSFYASTTYFSLPPAGRAEMTAAVVAPADDADAIVGLEILLVSELDESVSVTQVDDVAAGTQAILTEGVDHFVVALVNTTTSGDSKKPGLCIGTPEEVAACKTALLAGEGGAGGGGGGGAPSEGGSGGGSTDDDDEGDDGCGCRVQPAPVDGAASLAVLAIASALLRRRRRP